jgi:hypothetical protein
VARGVVQSSDEATCVETKPVFDVSKVEESSAETPAAAVPDAKSRDEACLRPATSAARQKKWEFSDSMQVPFLQSRPQNSLEGLESLRNKY